MVTLFGGKKEYKEEEFVQDFHSSYNTAPNARAPSNSYKDPQGRPIDEDQAINKAISLANKGGRSSQASLSYAPLAWKQEFAKVLATSNDPRVSSYPTQMWAEFLRAKERQSSIISTLGVAFDPQRGRRSTMGAGTVRSIMDY